MHRRRFLQATASAAALASLPTLARTGSVGPEALSWKQAFASAVPSKPWLNGYRTAARETFAASAKLQGQMPAGLTGSLYRNGPAKHEIGDYRLHHWFDGDGMIQAYRIGPEGVRHQARMIATPKYQAEKAADKPLFPGFGTPLENAATISGPDSLNVANISVLAHHNKLYALWEGGSAFELDAQSLDATGLHSFSEATQGVPFSAHPRLEADGNLWNFGYLSSASALVLWHIDPRGRVARTGIVPVAPMSMPHDFVVTRKHLIIMIPPLWFEPGESSPQSFLGSHHWHADQPTKVLVISKNDFSQWHTYELPAQWVFHYGNAWEDRSGVIHFDASRADAPTSMTQSFTAVMRGELIPPAATQHTQYQIDTHRRMISEAPLFGTSAAINTEFPCIDPRLTGRQNKRLFMLTARDDRPASFGGLNGVSGYHRDQDKLDTYTYPDTQMPEEHLFIPRPDSQPETDGWVLGSAYDYERDLTLLNIFSANHLADGPVCTATLPYGLPLGLHGKFVGT